MINTQRAPRQHSQPRTILDLPSIGLVGNTTARRLSPDNMRTPSRAFRRKKTPRNDSGGNRTHLRIQNVDMCVCTGTTMYNVCMCMCLGTVTSSTDPPSPPKESTQAILPGTSYPNIYWCLVQFNAARRIGLYIYIFGQTIF